MRLAIQRPFFLTWLGTYYMIHHSDRFIAFDDCLFESKTDFRSLWHRNNFDLFLEDTSITLPISFKESQKVLDLEINNEIKYIKAHLNNIKLMLASCPFVEEVFNQIMKPVYLKRHVNLIEFNMDMIYTVCTYLGIDSSNIKRSSEIYYDRDNRVDKYFSILESQNCDKLFADEGLANLLPEEDPRLIFVPLKKILPKHFNILEILAKHGKDTMQFLI